MLIIKQTTKLTGEIKFDNATVVSLYADVSAESAGNTTVNQSVYDQSLYLKNRVACRSEINEFYEKVWELEDSFNNTKVETAEK